MSEEDKAKRDLPKEFGPPPSFPGTFPASVVHLINGYKLAINRGQIHGLKMGQRFLVYALNDKEILDPETKESLGCLEIVRGTGKVVHLQEKLATIESDRRDDPTKRTFSSSWSALLGNQEITPGPLLEFEDAKVGDKAKPI